MPIDRRSILAAAGGFGLAAMAAAPASAAARRPQADALLKRILEKDGGPGVMAAVMRDGRLQWSGAAGKADLEGDVALTPRTRMRIGSVSKPLTAALALKLAEQGRLDLDGDIRALVPELAKPASGVITPALLAAHLSGIRQYDFANYLEANNVRYLPKLSDGLAIFAKDPLLSAPGEAHHYTSLGFNLLGVAAERAAKTGFGEAMAKTVAGPLGLKDTLIDHPLEVIERRTRFYTRFPDAVRNTIWRDSSDFYPSGGMLSTAADLAEFASAVFGGQWLDAQSMRRLTTEQLTTGGKATGYTFGWQIKRDAAGAVRFYEHGGETNGAYANLRYYPASRLAVAAIVNCNFMKGKPYFFEAVRTELPALFEEAAAV